MPLGNAISTAIVIIATSTISIGPAVLGLCICEARESRKSEGLPPVGYVRTSNNKCSRGSAREQGRQVMAAKELPGLRLVASSACFLCIVYSQIGPYTAPNAAPDLGAHMNLTHGVSVESHVTPFVRYNLLQLPRVRTWSTLAHLILFTLRYPPTALCPNRTLALKLLSNLYSQ
jgi:hypothetical protein